VRDDNVRSTTSGKGDGGGTPDDFGGASNQDGSGLVVRLSDGWVCVCMESGSEVVGNGIRMRGHDVQSLIDVCRC